MTITEKKNMWRQCHDSTEIKEVLLAYGDTIGVTPDDFDGFDYDWEEFGLSEIQKIFLPSVYRDAVADYWNTRRRIAQQKLSELYLENDKMRSKGIQYQERKNILKVKQDLYEKVLKERILRIRGTSEWIELADAPVISQIGPKRFIALFFDRVVQYG